jgi:DNA-binding transcriptional MerR regulator
VYSSFQKELQALQRRETHDADQNDSLPIGQVAKLTGVSAKNIRYYEGIGLLPGPARSANTYRRYSMADVNRLILLRRIRFLGVPLSQAKSLLIGATDAQCTDVQQELLQLVNARLAAIDRHHPDSCVKVSDEQASREMRPSHPLQRI